MKQVQLTVCAQEALTPQVRRLTLRGDVSAITVPGQFINIMIDGLFLRRPISVYDLGENTVTVIYKIVGKGTAILADLPDGTILDVLTGLGNGYDTSLSGDRPVLVGGGVGVPPLYYLARCLIAEGKHPIAVLGFNTHAEVFCEEAFRTLGTEVTVTTADGSYGTRGFVTDALRPMKYTHYYACGPEPMLRAVWRTAVTDGQLSFEERMGCGFGACMGCSCQTVTGPKRICKDGPVMRKGDILWKD